MLGDVRSQFGPAYNLWRQQSATGNVEDALFFKRLCGFNRVNFTTYRRGADLSFFQLYTGMVGKPVDRCARHVLRQFPEKSGMPDWSLTMSNNQRKRLNKETNDQLHELHGGIWIDAAHQLDGQGFWLFPEIRLVGCATDKGIYNGQLYTVISISQDGVRLQTYMGDDVVDFKLCMISCLRPAHALTYYGCQGRTLRGRVRLYVQHSKLTTTHITVGLGRATSPQSN